MTKNEAVEILKRARSSSSSVTISEANDAFNLAIQALEGKEEVKGRWNPEKGTQIWYVNGSGIIDSTLYVAFFDKGFFEMNNCFKTKHEAEMHKLRLMSIAGRGEEPKKHELFWHWQVTGHRAWEDEYYRDWLAEWFIGNCHKTKEACEEWYKQFGEAFLEAGI